MRMRVKAIVLTALLACIAVGFTWNYNQPNNAAQLNMEQRVNAVYMDDMP